jgi:hypothetical protein
MTPGALLLSAAHRNLLVCDLLAQKARSDFATVPSLETHVVMSRRTCQLERAYVRLAWATEQRQMELVDTRTKSGM